MFTIAKENDRHSEDNLHIIKQHIFEKQMQSYENPPIMKEFPAECGEKSQLTKLFGSH